MGLETILDKKGTKKVLLVQPRTTHSDEINFESLSILRLGLPALSGAIRDHANSGNSGNHYETLIWLEDRSGPLDLELIRQYNPDVILITGLVNEIPRAFSLSQILRQEFPRVPQLGGGPHMSALPGEALHFGCFDAIGHGQGTRYIGPLLDAITSLDGAELESAFDKLQLITYTSNGGIVRGRGSIMPMGLERAPEPLPDYDSIHGLSKESPLAGLTIQLSDSCPYRCTFCRVWTHNGDYAQLGSEVQKARWKQANSLRERGLVYTGKDGKAAVFIVDDLAAWGPATESNRPPTMTLEAFKNARQQRLNEYLSWKKLGFMEHFYTIAQVRIAHGDDSEMIDAMKTGARNFMVYAGMEATDNESLKRLNKRQSVEDFARQIGKLENAGIHVVGMGIIGLPHQTRESILAQARWFRKNTYASTVNWITPLWGTTDSRRSQFSMFADADGTRIMPMIGYDGQLIDPANPRDVMRPAELLPYEQLYTGRWSTFRDPNQERNWGPRESHKIVLQYLKIIRPVDAIYERAAIMAGLVKKLDGRLIPVSLLNAKQ